MKYLILSLSAFLSFSSFPQSDINSVLLKLEKTENNLKPGMSFEFKRKASEVFIVSSVNNYDVEIQKEEIVYKLIILKKEGDFFYVYSDGVSKLNSSDNIKGINISKHPFTALIRSALTHSQMKISGDQGILDVIEERDKVEIMGDEAAVIEANQRTFVQVDLKKICHLEYKLENKESVFFYNGQLKSVPDSIIENTLDCAEPVSQEVLKKLDLSAIDVCYGNEYEGNGEVQCVDKKDMSSIIKD